MSNSQKPFDKNRFWKSLKDYNNDLETLKAKQHEFMDGVTDDFDPSTLSPVSRRKFFAILSASAAFAATACSDYRDKGEIVPYNKRPEDVLPGTANYYASTCTGCQSACGTLIKTREGRPIKIDGNPDHPINKGKICSKGQASIYSLYDPERLTDPSINKRKYDWKTVDSEIVDALNDSVKNGKEISIVTGNIVSPSTKKVLDRFVDKYPTAKVYTYSASNDEQKRNAWLENYGTYEFPSVKLENANIILSIDSDFLGNEGNYIESMRKFTDNRESVNGTKFNRLYVAEGRLSSTGAMADYRMRVSPDAQYEFVMALINELLKSGSAISIDANAKSKIEKYSLSKYNSVGKERLHHLVADLNANRGKSFVIAGNTLSKNVHAAVNLLNEVLGNTSLYDYSSIVKAHQKYSTKEEIETLINKMNSGGVGVVIHFNSNPVFHLPSDYGLSAALKKVSTVVSLVEAENESSELGKYSLPINNQLESWGDAMTTSNVYSLQQPVISPIFNTREKEAILLSWMEGKYEQNIYQNFIKSNFAQEVYKKKSPFTDEKTFWLSALHDGVVLFNDTVSQQKFNLASILSSEEKSSNEGYVVHLTESYAIGDGKFANIGWLQELPHPISKITWDNYAAISPKTANGLSVEMNDLIEISIDGRKLTLPVLVQPGLSDNTINVEYGYGRKVIGEVGKNVGFDVFGLTSKNYLHSPFVYTNAKVAKVAGKHKLASTQEHHSLDDTSVKDFHRIRKIIQEGTVAKYQSDPHFLHHNEHKIFSITDEHKYEGVKWAMAIDLNKCTNCSVCISSCNVENNVPVVGKDQVEKGREMQWIRMDRYYSGTPEDPLVSNQPMLCQHCDNAPCENVCPVNATNHSPDGLNQMVYNRCVGTRYCSNNCPYKVRRFNYFNFRDHFADAYYENNLTALVNNPEVTVRSRGVMEKCTFCTQRIMEARSVAIKEGRELKGSDVVTACQQACPTNAITFGDANDPESSIAKLRDHNLSYHVLEELNIKPNVTYIAKLRNTHSEEIA